MRCRLTVLAVALIACTGAADGSGNASSAAAAVERRIDGVWRLTSYVPEERLSPVLLVTMQMETIVLRFESGRVRALSTGLSFDRKYRIANAAETTFKLFVLDDAGVEYESHCEFDQAGRVQFRTITAPWRGRGVLERQGPAFSR